MTTDAHHIAHAYDQILHQLNAGVIVLSPDKEIALWNQWMEKRTHLKFSEVESQTLQKIFPTLDNKRLKTAVDDAITKGYSAVLSHNIHKSPLPIFRDECDDRIERLPHAIDIKPIGERTAHGYYCLIQINDMKAAVAREMKLREKTVQLLDVIKQHHFSEARAQAIIDSAGDGVIIADQEGFIESCNQRALEIFGFNEDEIKGRFVDFFFTESYARRLPAFLRVARRGQLAGDGNWLLMEARHKDGRAIPINLNITVVNHEGRAQCIGIVRDLTELEESQRALQTSNEALEMALATGELWMWDWSADHTESSNAKTLSILGYDNATVDAEYLSWDSLIHPDDLTRVKEAVHAYFYAHAERYEVEYRVLKANGEWIWVYDRGRVVARDSQGNAVRAIGINQNITRRKLAEIEAQKASDEALEAARVKSTFLGNMSHELRTPMNGIMGVLNLLQNTDASAEQLEYIDVAKRSANALLKLIDNVLDFSKLDASSVELELIEFEPEEIIKDVLKLLGKQAEDRKNTLMYEVEARCKHPLITDPLRLRQVLLNLVGNAIKFTENGNITVRLLKLAGDEYLFEVEDTGVGIPTERQKVIFDAFAQADVSITREFGGTGLGLGISKQLVELMGGTINVVSTPGEGSIFSFSIMAETADENHTA